MTRLEFFYDLTSPWTYLAFTGIRPMAEQYGVNIEWRPHLVGGVFNTVNQELYAKREAAFGNERITKYTLKDLGDWARLRGIEINWPSFHPANAVKCMRGCFIAEEAGLLLPYSEAVFEAYWGRMEDVSDEAVLAQIATGAGLDGEAFLTGIARQQVKDKLRANTDELIARGGFGSPTIFIDKDDMYFGNDRLPLVEAALKARAGS
ncbi:MAG: 2-hydroxychromene-2-carboxylate isomerase [Halieaceae bacterium]|jgi:2-hydroxychromene-2-carboxylate isomerase|nr:2-hydroxychromene-2-carboxylate isomerase [Halieaceae bacterium]